METNQMNDSTLIVGLNPGEQRVIAGKIASGLVLVVPILSLLYIPAPWILFWISLPLSILLTCGQQYVGHR